MSLFARDTERLSRHKLALRHHTPSKNSTPKPYPTSKTQTIIHSHIKHNPIHNLNTSKNTSSPPTHSQRSTQKTPSSFSLSYFLPEQRPLKPLSFHEPQSSLNGKNLSRLNHPNFTPNPLHILLFFLPCAKFLLFCPETTSRATHRLYCQ